MVTRIHAFMITMHVFLPRSQLHPACLSSVVEMWPSPFLSNTRNAAQQTSSFMYCCLARKTDKSLEQTQAQASGHYGVVGRSAESWQARKGSSFKWAEIRLRILLVSPLKSQTRVHSRTSRPNTRCIATLRTSYNDSTTFLQEMNQPKRTFTVSSFNSVARNLAD